MEKPEVKDIVKPLPMMAIPRMIDYAWGLAVPDVMLQARNDSLQMGLMLHNAADGPLKVLFTNPSLKLSGCMKADPALEVIKPIIMCRGMNNIFWCPAMKKVSPNPMPKLEGELTFDAAYGHPDWGMSRKLSMKYAVTIYMVAPQAQIHARCDVHEDVAISNSIN